MNAAHQRWALSLADLTLLLLGFVLLVHARPDGARLATGLRSAFGAGASEHVRAAELFDPGEALLNARGRAFAIAFARAAGDRRVAIESRGVDRAARRFDGWELAAARAAALARALTAAGVADRRITLSIEAASAPGQRLTLSAG